MNTYSESQANEKVIETVKQLLVESGELHQREITIHESLSHLGIDSLGRAELFRRVEKTFNVSLPDKMLMEVDKLSDISAYLKTASKRIQANQAHDVISSHGDRPHVDPSQAQSLVDILMLYGEQAPDKAHIYFQDEDGKEQIITYGQLLESSLQIAYSLKQLGLRDGETVAIMQPTNPGFFYTFLGTLLAGGIPVPIYPPFRMHMLEAYAKTESRILSNAEVRILVTFEQAEGLSRLLQGFVPSLKHVTTVKELMQPELLVSPFKPSQDNYAFIQYTSGSTSDPKGVLLSHYNLLSNIRAYGKAIEVKPTDVAVSWLPLYHDMGLIAMWLGSLYHGIPLVLMTPFSFLNRPERWLWTIHHHRGTLTGAPNFAYELCVRKIEPALIEGLNLSSLRLAANGAEKVYPRTFEQFADKFEAYGLNRKALFPVYGLAESTVGLILPPLNRGMHIDLIDRKQFEEEKFACPSAQDNALSFVSCGKPMDGHEVRIVNDDDHVLPERHVGSLQFRGPSSMIGYYNNPRATKAVYHDGWIDSGDLAYQAESEIYITGRRKDVIIKAGRNLYPAEIEELVGVLDGVRQGCVTAFSVNDNARGTEQLVVVAETREKDMQQRNDILERINDALVNAMDISPDRVVLVTPHSIPKTSSGKLQRAQSKALYLQGKLERFRIPAWLQVAKLGAEWGLRKVLGILTTLGKFIYTVYVAVAWALILVPLYCVVRFSSQNMAVRICRHATRWMLRVAFCRLTINNPENFTAESPVVFAANHASYIDAIVALAVMPQNTRIVGKKELLSVPLLRTFMRKMGFLGVDRQDLPKGMEDTREIEAAIKSGHSIFIFPEGTFSYACGLRPFRLGAFKMAAETNTPVCPVAFRGVRYILRESDKLLSPRHVTVTVCPPIMSYGTEWEDIIALRQAVRTEVARYCGEPSLDFIVAQTVAPKLKNKT